MRKRLMYVALFSFAATCVLALALGAAAKEQEKKVTLDQVPAEVKATILKEAKDAKIREIEQVTQGEQVVYEAEWVADGQKIEIAVRPDGSHVGREGDKDDDDEGEQDERTSLDKVPETVKATILAEAKGAEIKKIEKVTKDGQAWYEAEWQANGKKVEVSVAPDGKLLKTEAEDADDDKGDDDMN